MDQNNSSPADFNELAKTLRETVTTDLAEAAQKMLDAAQNKLFDLSNEASSNEDQTRFFELMNQVRTQKQEIATEFSLKLDQALDPDSTDTESSPESNLDDTELSLVGQDEMEGMVLIKSIGGRAADKFQEPLSHLKKRLEALAEITSRPINSDAVTPTGVCQLFNDALQDNFEQAAKKTLFEMYDKDVVSQLGELYTKLNKALIEAGILPQIKIAMDRPVQHAHRGPSAATPGNIEPEPGSPDGFQPADGTGGSGPANFAGGGPGSTGHGGAGPGYQPGTGHGSTTQGTTSQGAMDHGVSGQESSPGQATSTYSGPAGSGTASSEPSPSGPSSSESASPSHGNVMTATPGSFTAPPAHPAGPQNPEQASPPGSATGSNQPGSNVFTHKTAGMPASQVGQTLSNYFDTPFTPETSHQKAEQNPDYFPASTAQHFGHQEIIQALGNLQTNTEFLNSTTADFNGEAIKKAVLNEIARASGGAVTKGINKIAEKTIDFIEMVFDAIIEDANISDAIKALLLRLQIPIIKTSMADQEFFIYDTHPARVLLDRIAEIGVGVTDHKDAVYIKLDEIVTGILTDYQLNEETFVKALERLEEFVEEQEAATRAIEEEEQLQLLRKHARSTVLKSLRASTTGKILPDAVHALILKRWPTLMFNHYLKQGKDNSVWINMILTLRQIIEFVQPIKKPEQLARIKQRKETMFEITENYLTESIKSKRDIRAVMEGFINTVQSNIDDANFNDDEMTEAEQHLEPDNTEQRVIEDEATELAEIPANVMPGMWFRVYMGEDHPARRCKLSVILIEDATLMFVDHKGELVAEKSFDEFNQEVEQGKTQMIMGHSTFDHAFKSALTRIH